MKNHELSAGFRDCPGGARVFIVNPGIDGSDYEQYAISRITFLMNSDPADTIIETESKDKPTISVENLVLGLAGNHPDGDSQVFVKDWEGQNYAYFDIAEVRQDPHYPDHRSLILGDWRCGG